MGSHLREGTDGRWAAKQREGSDAGKVALVSMLWTADKLWAGWGPGKHAASHACLVQKESVWSLFSTQGFRVLRMHPTRWGLCHPFSLPGDMETHAPDPECLGEPCGCLVLPTAQGECNAKQRKGKVVVVGERQGKGLRKSGS